MQPMKADDDRLQRFFDGELAPDEEAEVRAQIRNSDEVAQELQRLAQFRALMKQGASEWRGKLDSDAMFANIEAAIDAKAAQPALHVIQGESSRRSVVTGVSIGFALAAAVTLGVFAFPKDDDPTVTAPAPIASNSVTPAVAQRRGSEVLEIDFGGNTGTVFEVEGAVGQPLAVVWINDEDLDLR